jgi:hypothetical protein
MSEIKTNKLSPRKGTTQTIGDSGDTVSIASGATLSNAGTISTAGISGGTIDNQGTITGLAGVINWDTTAKTTNFNASSQTGYFVNTTSGQITITLPASPTAGDVIAIKDYANTFDTNKAILNANGNKIQGSTTNFEITIEGASSQFIYVDATRGWVLTDASKASDIAQAATFITATGGCITTCGDYKIHTFTGPGTFCVSSLGNPIGGPNNVDYLVVAGGGSGGSNSAGGGGAGGYRESHCSATSGCYTASPLATPTSLPISATAYPITVGGGASPVTSCNQGLDGSNSVFSTITSTGGGGGGAGYCGVGAGRNGGSGGGGGLSGGSEPQNLGGSGNTPPVAPPQGSDGGDVLAPNNVAGGGGGGGAISAGANAIWPGTPVPAGGSGQAGPGGNGATSSINGTPTARAGGGGGGSEALYAAFGIGGTGGGGNGGGVAVAGTTNTGGGGGGSGYPNKTSGGGGSGIVIIRYKYQ